MTPVNPTPRTGCSVFCDDWISYGQECFCDAEKAKVTDACGDNVERACIDASGAVSVGNSDIEQDGSGNGNTSSSTTFDDREPEEVPTGEPTVPEDPKVDANNARHSISGVLLLSFALVSVFLV